MPESGPFYLDFMDDILVLSPTRWRLRKAVKAVNEVLGSLHGASGRSAAESKTTGAVIARRIIFTLTNSVNFN